MTSESRKDQLFRRTMEAGRKQLHITDDGSLRPGDLRTFAATADFSVEWAVVEIDFRRCQVRVVAADLDPRVGTTDVAVADPASGHLTLRCAVSTWIDAETCAAGRRTGTLAASDLQRARHKLEELDAGEATEQVPSSGLASATRHEPEFEDLQQELDRARAALTASLPSAAQPPALSRKKTPPSPLSQWSFLFTPAGLAAAASLALLCGLFVGRSMTSMTSGPPPAATAEVLVSSPLVFFPSVGATRGLSESPEQILHLDSLASHLVLVLAVVEDFPTYRVEISRDGESRSIWSDELSGAGATELTLILPRQLVSAGRYRIHLAGKREGHLEELARHRLLVETKVGGERR